MKICFVLSHPASQLFGEVREAMIARDLAHLGHNTRVYRAYGGREAKRELFLGCVPVCYFPADDNAVSPHRTVSAALLDAVRQDEPDVLVFKGLGYDLIGQLLGRISPGQARIGFILGGDAVASELARADFVLAESEGQIARVLDAARRPLPCRTLPKYIDWATADRIHAERQSRDTEFDIVNVGKFEPRKNQIALREFFGAYRIAMVGDGEMQDAVMEAAKGHHQVSFLGALKNAAALDIVGRSRLMVHCSLWEGVPRSIFESLACGTPVVALEDSLQESFDITTGVRLVTAESLQHETEKLLAQPALLYLMGKEGRRFAREHHGPDRLAEAAGYISVMSSPG